MSLSRTGLFHKLGLIKIIDEVTEKIYEQEEERAWKGNTDSSPHGNPWHTSFHASQFPGDDPKACARKAIYELCEIPSEAPFPPRAKAIMEVGKAVEASLVERWERAGLLLSAGVSEAIQTGFEDADHWLSGSTDAVLLLPDWNRPHMVEIKSKDPDVIKDMQLGAKSFDPQHKLQLMCSLYLASKVTKKLWPDLEEIKDGSLYYVDRSRPRNTMEYFFDLDLDVIQQGLEKLAEWKEYFVMDILPERPKSWSWQEPPCKWCKFKRNTCKPDYKNKITYIRNSHGFDWADSIREDYSYEEKRQAILDRWNNGD